MDPTRWNKIKSIFAEASELPADQRDAHIAFACADDDELLAEVKSLLARAEPTLSQSTFQDSSIDAGATLSHGTRVAGYTILNIIGEGGMGAVYRAEQDRPRRVVALKLIRAGILSQSLLRRFEFEADVLARLDHPGIARIYEAGTADTGRGPQPFFAMELIEGRALDRYVADAKPGLLTQKRIELFHQICQAVQHAHSRGIVHRDLKPDNILVTAEGKPKILDFGIARAIGSDEQLSTTLHTESGQIVGTVPYMAPEQIKGEVNDLDAATDVYSLGVIGYELLSGRMPYAVKQKPLLEAARVICEAEPSRLSSIDRSLRGDVETIVQKALEKEKTRRYSSAGELAADVKRFLDYEPITARPPGTWYQLAKFARRNRVLVAGAAATFAVLIGGIIAATILAMRATRAEATAQQRAVELQQVADFQAEMLAQFDPAGAGALLAADLTSRFEAALAKSGSSESERAAQLGSFKANWRLLNATDIARSFLDRTVLDPAKVALDRKFAAQPLLAARLRQTLADVYENIGLYDKALPLQLQALETRKEILGTSDPATLTSMNNLGHVLQSMGRRSDAEPHLREVLETRLRLLGRDHPQTLVSSNNLGLLLESQGKSEQAERMLADTLQRRRRVLGEHDPAMLTSISNMGLVLRSRGKYADAERYYRESVDKHRELLGADNPRTLTAINSLGLVLKNQGKYEEAEPLYVEAVQGRKRMLGATHPDTLSSMLNLASLYLSTSRQAEANAIYTESLHLCREALGDDHPRTLIALHSVGNALREQGKLAEAEPYFKECLERRRRTMGENHPETIVSLRTMGVLLHSQGRLVEAEPLTREALERSRHVNGRDHPDTLDSMLDLGSILRDQRKLPEAESLLREVFEKRRTLIGSDDPGTVIAAMNLGLVLLGQNKLADADPVLFEAMETSRRVAGKKSMQTLAAIYNYADLRRRQGKLDDAELYAREAVDLSRSWLGRGDPRTLRYVLMLASVLRARENYVEAEELLRDALESSGPTAGTKAGPTTRIAAALADVLDRMNRAEEAAAVRTSHGVAGATTAPASAPDRLADHTAACPLPGDPDRPRS